MPTIKPIKVTPLDDYVLELTMSDMTIKTFNVKPYLSLGKFQELKDISLFRQARISFDAIEWPNGVDIDTDLL